MAKIRGEVNAYVDYVSRNNRTDDCACGGRALSNQSSGDFDFGERKQMSCGVGSVWSPSSLIPSLTHERVVDLENALVRQENQSLKKTCAALQREVQVLQHSLQFATSLPENAKPGGLALAPELEQDDELFLSGGASVAKGSQVADWLADSP